MVRQRETIIQNVHCFINTIERGRERKRESRRERRKSFIYEKKFLIEKKKKKILKEEKILGVDDALKP